MNRILQTLLLSLIPSFCPLDLFPIPATPILCLGTFSSPLDPYFLTQEHCVFDTHLIPWISV